MEEAGFLDRLIAPVVHRAKTDAGLICSVAATSVGLNIIAGDQYVADVMPSRVYRGGVRRAGVGAADAARGPSRTPAP